MHNAEKADFHVFACIKWGVVENRVGRGLRHLIPNKLNAFLRFILKENGSKTKKGEKMPKKVFFVISPV